MNVLGPDVKALEVRSALVAPRPCGPIVAQERGDLRLELTETPALVANQRGEIVGVGGMFKLFKAGVEQRIDPHRVILNPPLQVVASRAVYELDARGKAVLDLDSNPILISPRVL